MTAVMPTRTIPTRRMEFQFPTAGLDRHFMNGDIISSHMMTVLSCLFPEGEDFFVRSVRHYRDQITDPELKRQVAGFIGQEAIHGREHRAFNAYLGTLGYPTKFLDRRTHYILKAVEKIFPPHWQLAVTAALEHYTATLAEDLLRDPSIKELTENEEVQNIFLWHALEESEHKAVAFDVFELVCGDYRVRSGVMKAVSFGFIFATLSGALMSMATDPSARSWKALKASAMNNKDRPLLSKRVRDRIKDYHRRGFHPDDHDTDQLLADWRETLFGASGSLNDRVKTKIAA